MRMRPWMAVASVAVVLVIVALLWRDSAPPREAAGQADAAHAPAGSSPQKVAIAPAAEESAPTGAMSDPQIRALLDASSTDANLRGWLSEGDLVRRWAVALDNLAEGQLPRRDLGFLRPAAPFTAKGAGGKLTVDPRSYHRWDLVAAAINSVDPGAFATAVRAVHSPLQAAWRALGDPGRSLDVRAAEALSRIADAPVPRDPQEVVKAGKLYVFAEPELEQLPAVEKLLLRMGPKNAQLIQAKAREVSRELGYASTAARDR